MSKSPFANEVAATADRLRHDGFQIDFCFERGQLVLTRRGRQFTFSTSEAERVLRHARTVWTVADAVSFDCALLHVVAKRILVSGLQALPDRRADPHHGRSAPTPGSRAFLRGDDSAPSSLKHVRRTARCSFANRIYPSVGNAAKPLLARYNAE